MSLTAVSWHGVLLAEVARLAPAGRIGSTTGAVLAFGLGMQSSLDAVVLVYFVACGISRLARYNATAAALSDDSGKVRYFEGTPIPSSLALVLVLIHGYGDADGGALPGMAADAIDSTTLRSIAGLGVLGCLLAAAGHGILERLRSASAQISDDHQQP